MCIQSRPVTLSPFVFAPTAEAAEIARFPFADFAPRSADQFICRNAYLAPIYAFYCSPTQPKSSRLVPFSGTVADQTIPPVGTWMIDHVPTIHGREIAVLCRLPIAALRFTEVDSNGQLDPTKRADVPRYADWIKEGKRAIPIQVVVTAKGGLNVVDGHRRCFAHLLAGVDTIEAWVWPSMPHPEGLQENGNGPIMSVGLTFEHLP